MNEIQNHLRRLEALKRQLKADTELINQHLGEASDITNLMQQLAERDSTMTEEAGRAMALKRQLEEEREYICRRLGEASSEISRLQLFIDERGVKAKAAATVEPVIPTPEPPAQQPTAEPTETPVTPAPIQEAVEQSKEQEVEVAEQPSAATTQAEEAAESKPTTPTPEPTPVPEVKPAPVVNPQPQPQANTTNPFQQTAQANNSYSHTTNNQEKKQGTWEGRAEAFIGGNILGKIGILITLIGIFIGARYAIERDLISPTVRIILGYVAGGILAGIGLRLRKKYPSYSAVMLGGGLAVMYFITYLAYNSYNIIPQIPAFILMLLITAFTVYEALRYNQVVIAHIGLVGAYAIPFLVGSDSGNYLVFFSYIALINIGILFLSYKRYWKSLYYAAFFFTWLIFTVAYFDTHGERLELKLFFSLLFFTTFYATFMLHKLRKNEPFMIGDTLLLLANAAIFFSFSYALWDACGYNEHMGIVTLANAAIHLIALLITRSCKPADKSIYYLTMGLAVLFFTLTAPIEFDGEWVALFWALEALLLCYIGCKKANNSYLFIAAAIAFVTIPCWLFSRVIFPSDFTVISPFVNIEFLTDILTLSALGGMVLLFRKNVTDKSSAAHAPLTVLYDWVLSVFLILAGFLVMLREVSYAYAEVNEQLALSQLLVSSAYFLAIAWLNKSMIKSKTLNGFSILSSAVSVFLLLAVGILLLGYTYDAIAADSFACYLQYRYLLLLCLILSIYTAYVLIPGKLINTKKNILTWASYIVGIVWISNEYLLWVKVADYGGQGRLGLSIIWGCYATLLIVQGIRKKESALRIAGMCLFGFTILKLFFYDLIAADVLTKAIIFISLGAILLLVAFLYNRYKDVILGKNDEYTKEL